ncbi:NAD-binding protein [Pontiellaceae bacterium B12227]|nr:NAD-binding protein [Pontiellaceae bacterium B12227]
MSIRGRIGWGVIVFGGLAAYGLGVIGYRLSPVDGSVFSWTNALYASLQLFVLEANYQPDTVIPLSLVLARYLAPLVMAATAIRATTLLLKKEISAWRLAKLQNHIIICGLSREGYELVKTLREADVAVVIIEEDENNNFITSSELLGCHTLIGDVTSSTLLKTARVQFASQLYLLSGDDAVNLSIQMNTVELLDCGKTRDDKLKVWLHIDAIDMCAFLRKENAFESICPSMEVEVVSLHEVVARNLVIGHLYPIVPVAKDDQRDVHLIIVGFGRLGKTIVTRAVRSLVLPNPDARLTITAVDLNAESEVENLINEHPGLKQFCQITPMSGDIRHAAFRNTILERLNFTNTVSAMIFSIDDAYSNMSSALYVAEGLWKSTGRMTIPLFVRLKEESGWRSLLDAHKCEDEWTNQIIGFGSIGEICNKEVITQSTLDELAQGLHEYYSTIYANPENPSGQSWDSLSWTFKDSNRQAADHMYIKLKHLGLSIVGKNKATTAVPWPPEEPVFSELAKLEHRRWFVERTMAGWCYGSTTDKAQKISRDLVEWGELDHDAKKKDYEHICVYPKILERVQMGLVKINE